MMSNIDKLNDEIKLILEKRKELLNHLQELQANFEDMTSEEIIECRKCMKERIDACLALLEESESDNDM